MAEHSIARVKVTSFGPFGDVDIDLAPGLNVIVGDNATGKSQLLKLLYSCTKSLKDAEALTRKDLNPSIASKLNGAFRPVTLGRLTRRVRGRGGARIEIKYSGIADPLQFTFSSHAKREVVVSRIPNRELADEPVFLPSHELMSHAAQFLGLYDAYETGFEETWRDTTALMLRPALRGRRQEQARAVLDLFTDLLQGGTVVEGDDPGQFYLKQPGIGILEAPLLAEGHRKLAMIVRLISNGVLLEGGYLFWDEPEANLNPASQRAVADALIELVRSGSQIFVATHSMFLLRELQMREADFSSRYIGLSRHREPGQESAAAEVIAATSENLDDLPHLAALEAEAAQANRYLAW
ncbi:ATP/GTP-binding protein [Kineococcus sp. LSe6-4]|uniref:ATP/GTP-binding protein n=1 Tax=Kineococcus halophytocola TaxID=3234027 RepID=A0ABV4H3B3_9ACTN